MAKHLLLIEDDDALSASLAEQLEIAGKYRVLRAAGAEDALNLARVRPGIAAAILGPSATGGADLCRALRSAGLSGPILALFSGRREDATGIAAGLEQAGANASLAEPFHMDTLLARLRDLLQESGEIAGAAFPVGTYVCRPGDRVLVDGAGDCTIRLTEMETAILECLHRAGGRAVSQSVLLDEVWGYQGGVDTHTIATHIYRLRRKIEADPSKPAVLATDEDGYRLAS